MLSTSSKSMVKPFTRRNALMGLSMISCFGFLPRRISGSNLLLTSFNRISSLAKYTSKASITNSCVGNRASRSTCAVNISVDTHVPKLQIRRHKVTTNEYVIGVIFPCDWDYFLDYFAPEMLHCLVKPQLTDMPHLLFVTMKLLWTIHPWQFNVSIYSVPLLLSLLIIYWFIAEFTVVSKMCVYLDHFTFCFLHKKVGNTVSYLTEMSSKLCIKWQIDKYVCTS